jgi:ATP-dependent Lon protease
MREAFVGLSDAEKKTSAGKHLMKELAAQEKLYANEVKHRTRKIRQNNTTKFRALLKEKNVMNDARFFRDNLNTEEQMAVLRQVEEIKKHCEADKPYRLALLDADIPVSYKASAYKKLNTLRYMDPGCGEYYKVKQWVDGFMRIPFGKYKNLSLTIEDGIDKCHEFMSSAKQTLDDVVYGLDDAKLQILQMVGQWVANPDAIGNAIAIQGPMGTGKTTLVKDGISKILGRDFAFFALGGATDSSVLEGHSYTYEGSMWGKIIDIVIQCGNMNPVIYFDELDKVSDTPKGEEIIGILTHLTDTSQNSKFHDKYFSEIDFDLSRCLFIFSYNDESRVNPILRDRMYRIHTKGYSDHEKTIIARNYQLPKVREQVKFSASDITIPDETIRHIVTRFTDGEEGVRNLKRCLEIIYTKLNLYRLMKPGSNIFEKNLTLDVEFPLTVTCEVVEKLIKKSEENTRWRNMYN